MAHFVVEDEKMLRAPVVAEVVVEPAKLAGLTVISSELAADSDPSAAEQVGGGLARDLARKVDLAFFGSIPAPAPASLGALDDVTQVYAGSGFDELDAFTIAVSRAEQVGASISSWVAHPKDVLSLARLKVSSDSLVPLLAAQPGQPARRVLERLPLLSSSAVPHGVVYGIPQARTFVVVRQDANIDRDDSVFFTSDRVAVRAITRVGFAFPHPAAVVRIIAGSANLTVSA